MSVESGVNTRRRTVKVKTYSYRKQSEASGAKPDGSRVQGQNFGRREPRCDACEQMIDARQTRRGPAYCRQDCFALASQQGSQKERYNKRGPEKGITPDSIESPRSLERFSKTKAEARIFRSRSRGKQNFVAALNSIGYLIERNNVLRRNSQQYSAPASHRDISNDDRAGGREWIEAQMGDVAAVGDLE